MEIVKYIFVIVIAFISFGTSMYLSKQFAFFKKKNEEINSSEAIFLVSIILSSGLILKNVMGIIAVTYDNFALIKPEDFYIEFLKTAGALTFCGLLILLMAIYFAKIFNFIFWGKRNENIEFGNNNIQFALIYGSLILSLTLTLMEVTEHLLTGLIPNVVIPNYH